MWSYLKHLVLMLPGEAVTMLTEILCLLLGAVQQPHVARLRWSFSIFMTLHRPRHGAAGFRITPEHAVPTIGVCCCTATPAAERDPDQDRTRAASGGGDQPVEARPRREKRATALGSEPLSLPECTASIL